MTEYPKDTHNEIEQLRAENTKLLAENQRLRTRTELLHRTIAQISGMAQTAEEIFAEILKE